MSAGEGARELGVGGRDCVENSLVLGDDVLECEQPVRLNLPRAQLDLAHEKGVQARESRRVLRFDERAMKRNVGAG